MRMMSKNKKKIYDSLSPRILEKKKRLAQFHRDRATAISKGKEKVEVPAKADHRNNKPLFGPHKISPLVAPVVIPKKISPTEGMPTVNSKTGKSVKALIHKPAPDKPQHDPTGGAIDAKSNKVKKPRGRPAKSK